MFAKSKILGVSNGKIQTTPSIASPYAATKAKLNASLADSNGAMTMGGSAVNRSVNAFWQSNYQYMMTGIIPATPDLTDSTALSLFFRDMYLHDSVAGSAVDIQSNFPFSDWELRGLPVEKLKVYNDSLDRLNLLDLFPQISMSYLVDGFFTGSLIFDTKLKQFMDILIHDASCCTIIPSPFHNIDPTITVHLSGLTRQFLDNPSEYTKAYLSTMPAEFINLLNGDMFDLDPVSTLYISRKTLTDRESTSYLQRLLPCYLIEKVLFRGTLVEAQRRQRATTHIQAGDDLWTPTDDELEMITQLFQATEQDPLGAWIATRNNIQISEFRTAGDMWKWYETSESLTPMKLRALGISDAFLSGDASFAASESAYSTFVETVAAYRNHLTNKVFYAKLFPLIAVVNELYKPGIEKPKSNTVMQFLFNTNNRQALDMPTIHWHKQLEARDEQSQFDMLERISEHGIPVPITTWIAAAGIDIESLLKDLQESKTLSEKLAKFQSNEEGGMGDEDDGMYANFVPTTSSLRSEWNKLGKKALLERKFPEEDNAEWEVMPSGKRHLKVHQEAARKDRLHKIAKIMSRYKKDPNYRYKIVSENAKRGNRVLKGLI